MIAPVILSVVAFIAGHPTAIACDADVNPSPRPPTPGFVAVAWTPVGTGPIHMLPSLCAQTSAKTGTVEFARALRVVIREASIAGAARSESCAELVADIGVFDVLRRFYRVPFFTAASWRIGVQVMDETRRAPASFQPSTCRWPG